MDKKQRFFSNFGLPNRTRSRVRSRSASPCRGSSPILLFGKKSFGFGSILSEQTEMLIEGSGSLRPVIEGPDPDEWSDPRVKSGFGFGGWVSNTLTSSFSSKKSDLRLLLGVLGAPLSPIYTPAEFLPHLSIKNTTIECSSAQYILQQYIAACGGLKDRKNAYAMGKLKMISAESEFKSASRASKGKIASRGGFVLWQMNSMWFIELTLGNCEIQAGSNGRVNWRHTPWLGPHSAKGPSRPLRRLIQGLDPLTTASLFSDSRFLGERTIEGEDCFILKLAADAETLKLRSEGDSEIIRHVMFGYFSQRTGLLVCIEDSHLTRVQSNGADALYHETTMSSLLLDYRRVEGVAVAHSGRTVATLYKFGDTAASHTKTRLEEEWVVDEVAFNVAGLSGECFIPPAELALNVAERAF